MLRTLVVFVVSIYVVASTLIGVFSLGNILIALSGCGWKYERRSEKIKNILGLANFLFVVFMLIHFALNK